MIIILFWVPLSLVTRDYKIPTFNCCCVCLLTTRCHNICLILP